MDQPGQPQDSSEQPLPVAPKVFGVLSIVFGAVTFMFTLFSGCMAVQGQRADSSSWIYSGQRNPEERAKIYNRFYERTRPATVTQTAVYAIMSGLLLMIGIGQLGYRSWARKLSIYWGAAALLALVINIALTLVIVRPANRLLVQELQRVSSGLEAAMTSMFTSMASNAWMIVGSALLYAPYPVLMLIYFSRSQARSAMRR